MTSGHATIDRTTPQRSPAPQTRLSSAPVDAAVQGWWCRPAPVHCPPERPGRDNASPLHRLCPRVPPARPWHSRSAAGQAPRDSVAIRALRPAAVCSFAACPSIACRHPQGPQSKQVRSPTAGPYPPSEPGCKQIGTPPGNLHHGRAHPVPDPLLVSPHVNERLASTMTRPQCLVERQKCPHLLLDVGRVASAQETPGQDRVAECVVRHQPLIA